MADRSETRVWEPGRRGLTAGLVMVVTLVAFEALGVATVLPAALHELGHVALYGWVFSAFMLANLVGIAASGPKADQLGPAPVLTVGLVLFATGLALGGSAPSMLVLVIARAVQGLGTGAITSAAYVSVGRGYPESARARMLAVMSTAWVVPGLVGPAIAGVVAQHLSWRLVFLGLLPLLAISGALAFQGLGRLPPVTTPPGGHVDDMGTSARLASALALAIGAGMVLTGLSSQSKVLTPALVVPGLILATPGLLRLVPHGTFSARPGLPAAVAIRGLLTFSFFTAEAFIPLDLVSLRHQSTTTAGLVLTAATLSWTTGSWVQARIGLSWGRSRMCAMGLALVGLSVVGIAAVVESAPVALAALAWAVGGFGMGLAYPATTLIALDAAPEGSQGAASAAVALSEALGIAAGTGLGGAAVAYAVHLGHGPRPGIAAVDLLALAAAALGLVACARARNPRADRLSTLLSPPTASPAEPGWTRPPP